MFFFIVPYNGAATVTKLGMWFLYCTAVPRKAHTSVVSSHSPQHRIFPIVSLVGLLPSYEHWNPAMVMWSLQMVVLGPKKVPPAYFIHCNILFTASRCSNTNLCIPGLRSRVSTLPAGFSYLVSGPLIGMLSMCGSVYLGISSLRI